MNYANSKIYKIVSPSHPELGVYFGSTTQLLARRLGMHRSAAKCPKSTKSRSVVLIDSGDAIIVLVENFPCESKAELNAREAYWITTNDCINKNIPGRTNKQWIAEHQEEVKIRMREYRAANREKISAEYKTYCAAHKEELKAKRRIYEAANRKEITAKTMARRAANK